LEIEGKTVSEYESNDVFISINKEKTYKEIERNEKRRCFTD
jgi:hypothetical protein